MIYSPLSEMSAPPAPASTNSVPNVPSSQVQQPAQEILPQSTTLIQAVRIAIQQDKPIQMDYYVDSANNKAFLGEDGETKEKVLVKSKEEFTSQVTKMYKSGDDFIILSENSIYIVSGKIQKRKVNLAALQGDS
jgi:hypothetical protein